MTISDKITTFCNDGNKTSTSVELLAINILCYMSYRSNVGLGIKSTAGLKNLHGRVEWKQRLALWT